MPNFNSAFLLSAAIIILSVIATDGVGLAKSKLSTSRAYKKCVQTERTTTLELRTCLLASYDRMEPPFVDHNKQTKQGVAALAAAVANKNSSNTNDDIPPFQHQPVDVTLSMFPTNLMEVDDKHQQITTHFFVTMKWRDRRLSWRRQLENKAYCRGTPATVDGNGNTTDYVDVYDTILPPERSTFCYRSAAQNLLYFNQSQTWLPSLVIFERLNDGIGGSYYLDRLIKDAYFLQEITIGVDAKGRVNLRGFFVERCGCRMMTRLFPFDYQTCNLSVMVRQPVVVKYVNVYERTNENGKAKLKSSSAAVTETNTAITTKPTASASFLDGQLSKAYDLGEWRLDVRAARRVPHVWSIDASEWEASLWIYQLGLIRNPVQHLLTWVIPPVITSVGAILGLYLGCNPSERYKFGSSIVITLILMMTSINDRLPVSDDGYPVLGVLYFGLCVIVTVAAFLSTIPTKLRQHFRHELGLSSSKRQKEDDERINLSSSAGIDNDHTDDGSEIIAPGNGDEVKFRRRSNQNDRHDSWVGQQCERVIVKAQRRLSVPSNDDSRRRIGLRTENLTAAASQQQRNFTTTDDTIGACTSDFEMFPLKMKRTTTQSTRLTANPATSGPTPASVQQNQLAVVSKNVYELESLKLPRSVSQQRNNSEFSGATTDTVSSIVMDSSYYENRGRRATFDNHGDVFTAGSKKPDDRVRKSGDEKHYRQHSYKRQRQLLAAQTDEARLAQTSFMTAINAAAANSDTRKYETVGDNIYYALRTSPCDESADKHQHESRSKQNGELYTNFLADDEHLLSSPTKLTNIPNGIVKQLAVNDDGKTILNRQNKKIMLLNGAGGGSAGNGWSNARGNEAIATADRSVANIDTIDTIIPNGGGMRSGLGLGHEQHAALQRTATTHSKSSSIFMRNSVMRRFFTILLKRRRFDMLLMTLSLASQFILIAYAVKEWAAAVRQNSFILR